MASEHWSDEENDLIVDDYFTMLAAELAGKKYVKAHHRRELLPKLKSRNEGAVEFKHQNISAVMLGIGQPLIVGYKPASQFQLSLVDAVLRRLEHNAPWLDPQKVRNLSSERSVRDPGALWVGPPPAQRNEPPPIDPQLMAAVARKYDVAERDERNRALGTAGEELVLDFERFQLRQFGRADLADRIVWTSKEDGDGAGYDIQSYTPDGSDRFIEVKTTNGWERTPFHVSRNELRVADEKRDSWCLLRLYSFARDPKAFELRPPMEKHVELTPTSFLASLR
ncbi:MAG: DUF3883 domain-containing protein [Pseudomonadota bacterium]